jgi:hypothetical protein
MRMGKLDDKLAHGLIQRARLNLQRGGEAALYGNVDMSPTPTPQSQGLPALRNNG